MSTTELIVLPLFPACFDFGGLHDARLVAPGIALVAHDRSDVGVGELLAERLHGRAGKLVCGVAFLRAAPALGAGERRKRGRRAPAVRLVARDAVRAVDLLAA